MTRKRFIRLIMAYNIQRNEAVRMAQKVADHGSYDRLFANYRALLVFRPLGASIRRLMKETRRAARGIENFTSAFVGINLSSDDDTLHHTAGGLQTMTQEEHEAAHILENINNGRIVYIFKINSFLHQKDIARIRDEIRQQIDNGLLILNPHVSFVGREIEI